jgi:hypothetical protein
VKTRAVCLGLTIEIIVPDAILAVNCVLLGVSSVANNKGVADECLGEEIAGSLNALRVFYSFLSRGSKCFIEELLLLYCKITNN